MEHIIHIVGAFGTGTSTLAQAAEREYAYEWLNTDDFFENSALHNTANV